MSDIKNKNRAQWVIVPVSYEVYGFVAIRAASVEDAVNMIRTSEDDLVESMPVVRAPEYREGTYQIDTDEEYIRIYTELFRSGSLKDVTFSNIVTDEAKRLDAQE